MSAIITHMQKNIFSARKSAIIIPIAIQKSIKPIILQHISFSQNAHFPALLYAHSLSVIQIYLLKSVIQIPLQLRQ